ncbi:WSC-domain-containing protein [Wilcoxina mikolae CBS 423.85]|nr:WSC-domain-containing protein [Wilcoxina mikolae CBS 423.85]
MIWRTQGKGNYKGFAEQFYAQPLIYTPPGQRQYVYAVSQQNYVYRIDAVTGELLNFRQLMIPFLVADLNGCNDISDCIGSTATGVIDPGRNAWYLTTKTYANQNNQNAQGLLAGRYWIHALDVITLEEKPGFPVLLDGIVADNAPWRMFEGGKHHQRPALMQTGDYVYAGFASHCVQYNFTGWVIGWHADTGKLVSKFATEGGKEKDGKGGGIWMSGGGLASDNPGRMFFASGNGYASQLSNDPVPGRQPPTALEEAVVNMAIHENGSLTPTDFFMPWEKQDLDGMDKDLGTSGFILMEPNVFSTSKVQRIGCVAGKTGKLYFLNLDDLGGYQMGPNRKDAVLQTIQLDNAVFASAGTYPFEGGYVYVTPVGYETIAFKFGQDENGNPVFTEAGRTKETAAGRQGVGHSTITSLKGQPGSGILWIVDVDGVNLRAYGTVPVDGILPTYALLNNAGQSKFSRPSFGNGKVYVTTSTGYITAFGSPVNMPLNCSSPYDAGTVNIGNSSVVEISCRALTPLTVNSVDLDSTVHFTAYGYPKLPYTMALGNIIKLKSKFQPVSVGPLSTNINLRTTNLGTQKFATNTPVVIRGKAVSQKPVLKIQPNVLSFGEIITGSNPPTLPFAIQNGGMSVLKVLSYKWSFNSSSGPWITPNSPTSVGSYSFKNLPTLDKTIASESDHLVTTSFNPSSGGYWPLYLVVATNGGTATVGFFGTSGSAPKAKLEWQLSNGTWIEWNNTTAFAFDGGAFRGTKNNRKMRLSNIGGTTLTTTISKPPVSGPLAATNPLGSLAEGSQIPAGGHEEATLVCSPPKGQVNMDPEVLTAVWTLNNNDPLFGKHEVYFKCSAITRQVGILDSNKQAYFRYMGCYRDSDPVRRMDVLLYSSTQNTNRMCLDACDERAENFPFAATEYEGECWCGKKLPPNKVADSQCDYLCLGNFNEYCGGDGTMMSLFYDRRLWTPDNSTNPTSPTTSAPTASPTTNPDYQYLGCAIEGTGGRALTGGFLFSTDLTPQMCQQHCTSLSFPLSGVEYSTECYCGTVLSSGATLGSQNCNMPCPGDVTQICGGPSALSIYQHLPSKSNSSLPPPTSSPTPSVNTNYTYLGCATEGTGGRALPAGTPLFSIAMTQQLCQKHCTEQSFSLSGTEYASECYCANALENNATLGSINCNMPCSGNTGQICGGPNALSVWRHN